MAMKNLAQRFLVALVAVPILLFVIYQASPHPTWFFVCLLAMLSMHEFFSMGPCNKRQALLSTMVGGLAVAGFYWLPTEFAFQMTSIGVVGFFGLYYLFGYKDMSQSASRCTSSISGVFYAGCMTVFIAIVRRDALDGADMVILLLMTAWLSDTGGYFAGKSIGGKKLYPSVSPNKTWAGSIGGIATVALGAAAFKFFRMPDLSWPLLWVLVIPGTILGQMGDLFESLLKRSYAVKDSGALLPGHGGLLDRVDAVLFIAPYFYLVLKLAVVFQK